MGVSEWLAVASGVAIAAACGLRAFLPLLVLGAAARFGLIQLSDHVTWLGQDLALIALGVATVLELAADKIPIVDHALDAIGLALRPLAAWFAGYALLWQWPAPWGQAAALALALIALAIQGVKAKVRLGSTATTLGVGNPVVSVLEDATALMLSLSALFLPLLVLALLVGWALLWSRRQATAGARGA